MNASRNSVIVTDLIEISYERIFSSYNRMEFGVSVMIKLPQSIVSNFIRALVYKTIVNNFIRSAMSCDDPYRRKVLPVKASLQ